MFHTFPNAVPCLVRGSWQQRGGRGGAGGLTLTHTVRGLSGRDDQEKPSECFPRGARLALPGARSRSALAL